MSLLNWFLNYRSKCRSVTGHSNPVGGGGGGCGRWIFRKWDLWTWTGSSWLRVRTVGGFDWLIDLRWGSSPHSPDAPRPYRRSLCVPYQFNQLQFQMAPRLILLMSSGSKTKEPRSTCLSEAKASHSQRMWTEVSSSAPHLLHIGLSDSPSRWRCLIMVLCPVRRTVSALDCVLLKGRNLALVPRQGPEITSGACLWESSRPRHHIQCWLTNQRVILLRISCLETPKPGWGPTNSRAEPPLACPGTQYSPTECRVQNRWRALNLSSLRWIFSRAGKSFTYYL